jgi:hypothetical protein
VDVAWDYGLTAGLSLMNYQFGSTALHWASLFGHLPVAELLVKIGQDPNVANKVRSLSVAR